MSGDVWQQEWIVRWLVAWRSQMGQNMGILVAAIVATLSTSFSIVGPIANNHGLDVVRISLPYRMLAR